MPEARTPSPSSPDPSTPSRFTTADLIGPTLIFLGAFLIAVTIALPTLFVDRLRSIPLSTDQTTVSTAGMSDDRHAQILDRCSLNTPRARLLDATLVRQQRVVAVRPADSRRVTLQAGASVQADRIWLDGKEAESDAARPGSDVAPAGGADACTSPTVSAVTDRITLNRRSALPDLGAVDGARGNSEIQYDANSAPVAASDRRGYTYVLPFDPPTSGAQYFDVTTRRTVPLVDAGQSQVGGRTAIRYRADIPDTDLAAIGSGAPDGTPATRITRPASWFGITGGDPGRQVTATLHHRARWDISVDAATGVILDERVDVEQTYRVAGTDTEDAGASLTNLRATFGFDVPTQRAMADTASSLAGPVVLWGRVVPLIAGIVGVLALIAGAVLTFPGRWQRWVDDHRPRRRGRGARPDARPEEPQGSS
ncbi:DUF3068 domain-containing protein [Gordonia aichiensis]|uniref:DUF3068 domain-containing protein n=1 Tax=Gordonia aichiensis NBRC 108223 TaxID=1220583 RepID=L7KS32_9ACTN|nr:DUF3068 domain-containing protein [Gordonia aichiensis]GAC50493.1 hypothetical protein GOACH_25_00290 [Gordonia aichiensis NBRC 108223]